MIFLNLDSTFRPYGNTEIKYEKFVFSGGEPHIKILDELNLDDEVCITQRINSFNDLGFVCMAVDALRRMGIGHVEALIPYFPAARQDRLMTHGEPLSVKVYAEIINQLKLKRVTIFDPHSDVTPALLENCKVITNHSFIKKALQQIQEPIVLIAPDGGALKKIYKLTEALGGAEVIQCSKQRDVNNGKITGYKVYADDLSGKTCLVVDDICDGGATFIRLAQELQNKNAKQLYLAVSHGIFSKGYVELLQYYNTIFTTNSIKDIAETGVKQIKISL